MYGYIYKITNSINGKIYIGKTKSTIEKRFCRHIQEAKFENKNNYNQSYFHQALLKYGIENFNIEIIDIATTKEELNTKEIYWIKEYNATNREIGYNLTIGGDGGDTTKEYIWINDGVKNKYIKYDESIPYGWKKGRLISNQFKYSSKNKKWINNQLEEKLIDVQFLAEYLNDGWILGMIYRGDSWKNNIKKSKENISKETKNKQSRKRKEWYQNNPNYISTTTFKKGHKTHNKGKVSITNGNKNKYIEEKDIDNFIKDNPEWKRGNTQKRHEREK